MVSMIAYRLEVISKNESFMFWGRRGWFFGRKASSVVPSMDSSLLILSVSIGLVDFEKRPSG